MILPARLNPGPWVGKVVTAAPISLFLFFFLLFIFSIVRGLDLHPMHYFFIGAAFFSFHLLLAYLVDHMIIHYAFVLSSVVSIVLVTSYMRLVLGTRLAFVEIGLGQFVYLVLFSYTFFFPGYTGLAVTLLCFLVIWVGITYLEICPLSISMACFMASNNPSLQCRIHRTTRSLHNKSIKEHSLCALDFRKE